MIVQDWYPQLLYIIHSLDFAGAVLVIDGLGNVLAHIILNKKLHRVLINAYYFVHMGINILVVEYSMARVYLESQPCYSADCQVVNMEAISASHEAMHMVMVS